LNRQPSTVWRADIAGYDSDAFCFRGQGPLCPGASSTVPIDGHDTHALSGKMADDFQSDPSSAAGYHRCASQLSQRDTSMETRLKLR
jgi:hypothetical protein